MSGTLTQQASPTLLDPNSQPRFVNDLPVPPVIDANKPAGFDLQIKEVQQWLGLVDEAGDHLDTTVWGYGQPGQAATYPGPTLVAHEGVPITVHWDNALPVGGHLLPVDETIHFDEGELSALQAGYIPIVTHLHGGHNAAESDGGPEAWFTQNPSLHGPDFPGQNLDYPNDQQAATLWYHDHALGITRLNVYAGLAGFYLLEDQNEDGLVKSGVLPDRAHEFGLAIQDRAFTADGQLYLPAHPGDPIPGTDDTVPTFMGVDGEPINPTIMPEFFGDFMLVNGMAWPKMDVQPTTYRLHLLNGSDSRFDVLQLDNPHVKVTLVGSEGGLLQNAVTVMDGDGKQEKGEQIVLGPGERVDAVFDFSGLHAGDHVTLENLGPAFDPFQGFAPHGSLANGLESAQGTSVGEIMRFDVGAASAGMPHASVADGTPLNPGFVQWTGAEATTTRKLGLFETDDPETGRTTPLLGVVDEKDSQGNPIAFGPRHFDDPTTEVIKLGTTEKWELYNFTADAHPIHLHQVQFQVLDRHEFRTNDANHDGIPGDAANEVVTGRSVPLAPTDLGWQDTVWVAPGQSVSIEAKFDLPGEYVWHCHILSHEDNEMMRPFLVTDQLL